MAHVTRHISFVSLEEATSSEEKPTKLNRPKTKENTAATQPTSTDTKIQFGITVSSNIILSRVSQGVAGCTPT